MKWFRRKKESKPSPPVQRESFFSTHAISGDSGSVTSALSSVLTRIFSKVPTAAPAGTMDSMDGDGSLISPEVSVDGAFSHSLALWYANQGFLGHTLCALIAQHWLINKACVMPGRDGIRRGYTVKKSGGGELPPDVLALVNHYDEHFDITGQMRDYVSFGRIFGIRVALFDVRSTDLKYYEKPFNPDGITPFSYRGIVQVDPQWCAPELSGAAMANPEKPGFMTPTHWMINGKRYHRSHLMVFIPFPVADILKPAYQYGGVSVPQRIMERVYAAERVANEAPHMALTKRTTVLKTDMAKVMANQDAFEESLSQWVKYRDNYGVKIADREEDDIQQFDTALADFDNLIMTQYQIVAAASHVPGTKLLGTQPKGFNATGEFDESNYHEELESLQAHDLTPFLRRHHLLLMRSHVAPKLDINPITLSHTWNPLDSLTAKEVAEINEINSRTDLNLVNSGSIDQYDARDRLIADPRSGYSGITRAEPPDEETREDEREDRVNGQSGSQNAPAPASGQS